MAVAMPGWQSMSQEIRMHFEKLMEYSTQRYSKIVLFIIIFEEKSINVQWKISPFEVDVNQ